VGGQIQPGEGVDEDADQVPKSPEARAVGSSERGCSCVRFLDDPEALESRPKKNGTFGIEMEHRSVMSFFKKFSVSTSVNRYLSPLKTALHLLVEWHVKKN